MIYGDIFWIHDKKWAAVLGLCKTRSEVPRQSSHIQCIAEQREYKTEYMASVGLDAMWNKWSDYGQE